MTISLSLANLNTIAAYATVPKYERSDITAGIIHFGIGNFHRSHQAVYLDALFNTGQSHDWGVIGAGVTAHDNAMREKLKRQDYLTTVIEQEADRSEARVTGAMIDFIDPQDRRTLIARLADPAIRIVSMTITEGGYFINPASGTFNPDHPTIVHDSLHPDDPKTIFGIILAGLKRRRAAGCVPFTVMSCDNIPENGRMTENVLVELARLTDRGFADWISGHVAFPNSMVDRITPVTGEHEIKQCREIFGIDDNSPVYCEEFRQWVLEDRFTAGRPALEQAGVIFAADAAPYELMKIRILNGGHAAIAYAGELLDIDFVHESMAEPLIRNFLIKLEQTEIIPCVPPVPHMDIEDYLKLVVRRFSNPKIKDTIARLAQDGSNRQPKFILPSVADRLHKGEDVQGLALVSALWCRYFQGISDSGRKIQFNDANATRLHAAAIRADNDPLAFLLLEDIFDDIGKASVFQERFTQALTSLQKKGTRATLSAYVS